MTSLAAKYKPYPAYKPSGVEWFGEIPAHWEVKRLKHLVGKVGSGKTPKGGAERYVGDGVMLLRSQNVHFGELRLTDVAYIDADTDDEMAGSRVLEGDVLLNITGASLGRSCVANLSGKDANVNQHVCILRPNQQQVQPEFLAYSIESRSLQSQIFNNENGVSRDALNFEQIGDLVFARPSKNEQYTIAAFLDRETARIDALVSRKERLIELLQEKRAALITRAVTKGLDPNAPLKDSCVEWLGEIPAHWDVKRLKYLGELQGGAGFPHEEQWDTTQEYPFFKVGDMAVEANHREMVEYQHTVSGDTAIRLGAYIFPPSTIVFAKVGAALMLNRRRMIIRRSCIDNNMMGFIPRGQDPDWMMYWLSSLDLRKLANPGAVPSVNEGQIREQEAMLPPLPEQQAIAAFLDRETAKLDGLVVKVQEAIQRLRELRTALISAAVTGRIDVREEAGCK